MVGNPDLEMGDPTEVQMFSWLCLENNILTWDDLKKMEWLGLGLCVLCGKDNESI